MLEDKVKDLIIPRLIFRDKKADSFDRFLDKWGKDRPFLLEISKYELDLDCELNQKLNDYSQYFLEQYNIFDSK